MNRASDTQIKSHFYLLFRLQKFISKKATFILKKRQVRNYLTTIYINWRKVFADRSMRNHVIIIAFLYFFLFKFCRIIMTELEIREGIQLADPLLSLIPAYDCSEITFALTYIALVTFILTTIISPARFIIGLQGYCLLIIMRTLSIYLVPLEPPAGLILLKDPVTIIFMSTPAGGYIVKDLFFSGHLSTIVLFFFVSNNKTVKKLLLVLGFSVSTLLLIQHVHYTIDILAAPFFSFLAYKSGLYLYKIVHQKNNFALKEVN
jgi:PAP2 superfamily C-terminal